MRRIVLCDNTTCAPLLKMTGADDSMILTTMGRARMDSLTPSTKASHTFTGASSPNGDVLIESRYGGADKDMLRFGMEVGDTGAGHEDRALAVARTDGDTMVTFGTDGSGNSVVPTATQVADLVNAETDLEDWITATAQGDGSAQVAATALTNLSGGAHDGDWIKIEGHPSKAYRVAGNEAL